LDAEPVDAQEAQDVVDDLPPAKEEDKLTSVS